MNRIVMSFAKLAAATSLTVALLGTTGCYGEIYGEPGYYPPDDVVALEDPLYYDGHATYFYGNRWYYRDGGRWSYYRSEPAYLRQQRAYRAASPARGRARGGASPGGGHGGRR